jgi:predicted ATPase
LTWASWGLWFLGYPDQALKRSQEAVALARQINHPLSLSFGLNIAAVYFHLLRQENRIAQDYVDSIIRADVNAGFPLFQAYALLFLGRLKTEEGRIEEGKDRIREGLARFRAIGNEYSKPCFLAWLAEGSAKAGQVEEGLSLLEEALTLIETGGERMWEAEVHRVKGELLKLSSRVSEAETSFRRAIEVARRQEAKSWELRATLSLSRLLQKQGRSEEARQLLSEIYGWFTEGFDTPDLQEARALLEELGG